MSLLPGLMTPKKEFFSRIIFEHRTNFGGGIPPPYWKWLRN